MEVDRLMDVRCGEFIVLFVLTIRANKGQIGSWIQSAVGNLKAESASRSSQPKGECGVAH